MTATADPAAESAEGPTAGPAAGSAGPAKIRLTDSTLRDGSHAMAHRFTEEQVRGVVHGLDSAGVEVIEVTHGDGLGGSSFNYGFSAVDDVKLVAAAVDEARQAKIAVLLLPGLGTVEDLRMARDAGASVARIATHCTEADVSLQHFAAARDMGMETVGFLMLAHRVGPEELAKQARIMVDGGAQCVYVVDSAGALVLGDAQERVAALIKEVGNEAQVGFHGHQNLSLGIANSVLAAKQGALQIDGALCALGAGAGQLPHRGAGRDLRAARHPDRRGRAGRDGRGRRTWSGRSFRGCRSRTAARSPRATRACTPASCCMPSGPRSATRCPRTRSCSGSARLATWAARKT